MELGVLEFFKGALSAENWIEKTEKKQILRALRTIYFFPDNSLKWLDRLIETDGWDEEAFANLQSIYDGTAPKIEEAIVLLTSDSVATNLHIPLEILKEIRVAASMKLGIRSHFTAMFFGVVILKDRELIYDNAVRARKEISDLNKKLCELDELVSNVG